MNDIKDIFAKNLSKLRQASGMTQLELGERLNYSDKTVSKWERGESIPDAGMLKQIADEFGVSVDYLLEAEHDHTQSFAAEPSEEEEALYKKHQTIRHIVTIHRYARPEDVPARTVFVITTDGLENASHRFRLDEVKRMIEHEQEKYGWEFLFLGANIDAVGTAGDLGIRPDRSANFHADSQGVEMSFRSLNCALSQARKGAPLPSTWKDDVDNDYVNRK